jgi:hypothetical protein
LVERRRYVAAGCERKRPESGRWLDSGAQREALELARHSGSGGFGHGPTLPQIDARQRQSSEVWLEAGAARKATGGRTETGSHQSQSPTAITVR